MIAILIYLLSCSDQSDTEWLGGWTEIVLFRPSLSHCGLFRPPAGIPPCILVRLGRAVIPLLSHTSPTPLLASLILHSLHVAQLSWSLNGLEWHDNYDDGPKSVPPTTKDSSKFAPPARRCSKTLFEYYVYLDHLFRRVGVIIISARLLVDWGCRFLEASSLS